METRGMAMVVSKVMVDMVAMETMTILQVITDMVVATTTVRLQYYIHLSVLLLFNHFLTLISYALR